MAKDGPTALERLINGILPENPVYRQLLGMCPTLAVTGNMKAAMTMSGARRLCMETTTRTADAVSSTTLTRLAGSKNVQPARPTSPRGPMIRGLGGRLGSGVSGDAARSG